MVTHVPADDVPMSRVKFNANTEYAYLQNFKILQSKPCLFDPDAAPFTRSAAC